MGPEFWIRFLATGFGSGLAPKAPGTVGTLVALPMAWLLSLTGGLGYLAVTLALLVVSVWVCQAYEQINQKHDASEVVIDEIVGFLVTMALVPVNGVTLVLGFVLFRVFDIFKPFPIGYLDRRVKGGLGVVIDDVVAGLFSNVLLQFLVIWLF